MSGVTRSSAAWGATARGSTALPVIPTSLPEVDVVERWRDGMPAAVVVLEVDGEPDLSAAAAAFDVDTALLESAGVTATAGEVRAIPHPDGRPRWTVGAGSGKPEQWRGAGGGLARTVRDRLAADFDAAGDSAAGENPEDLGEAFEAEYVQVRLPEGIGADAVGSLTLGLCLGGYQFRVTGKPSPPLLRRVLLVSSDDVAALRETVQRTRESATATALARDLANAPSNIKDPAWLTGLAARLAEEVAGLSGVVRDEKWLAQRGFGGMLAVGGGSSRPPRLLELTYDGKAGAPGGTGGTHLVLVGKGITFDTGGLSIKPAEGMHLMRTDMSGGAAVIAALLSIARLRLPVRVTGLVPAAENHVSGSAYRPGDIVRHYGGTTTEVTNTDAEGRMVLADTLAYAVRHHEPDLIVDVATLTGAMKVALGLRTGGVFASEERLGERVREAGQRAGEAWWPMPLLDAHTEDVRGEVADVRQAPPGPGGITAALFLREFTGGLPWAHLDIAGPARADKPYAEVTPGGTGFAARTLVELAAGLAR